MRRQLSEGPRHKKYFLPPILSIAFVVIFIFCVSNYLVKDFTHSHNSSTNQVLDTSNLKKVEMSGDNPALPVEYIAPSTEVAIKSLPFNIKLPKDLPFEHQPFVVTSIQDIKRDGKKVRIILEAKSKNKNDFQLFSILATNQQTEISNGEAKNNGSLMKIDGVYYKFDLISEKHLSATEKKKTFEKIAEQMK